MELSDQTIVLRCISLIFTAAFVVWMLFNFAKPGSLKKSIGFVVGCAIIMVLNLISLNFLYVFLWSFPLLLWVTQLLEDLFGWDAVLVGLFYIPVGAFWFLIVSPLLAMEIVNWAILGFVPLVVVGLFVLIVYLIDRS